MQNSVRLELASGKSFEGKLIGAPLLSSGELVFTTAMVGYSEALSDPSYFGQILVFAYPLVGNYGIPASNQQTSGLPMGMESDRIHTSGVILTKESVRDHHWSSYYSLDAWLANHGVPGIVGIDTRALIQLMVKEGKTLAKIIPAHSKGKRVLHEDLDWNEQTFFDPTQISVVDYVCTQELRTIGKKGKKRVGLIDCGTKWNIVRSLLEHDVEVVLVPPDTSLDSVDCDSFVLSNGPGNPSHNKRLINQVSSLLTGQRPILGICLGHQILALAAGAKTVRLPFGHRSHNQPVQEVGTKRAYMTSQNHGYAVDVESLPEGWHSWFINLNDGTSEGIQHSSGKFRSVQFHPEAAGGPCDTSWIFEKFVLELS